MDVEHVNLLNAFDYNDLKSLKKAFKCYNNLYKLALMGNRAAIAIFTDLDMVLNSNKLTLLQIVYIRLHLIDGNTLQDIADGRCSDYTQVCSPENVFITIRGGLKRASKLLASGELYDNGRRRVISEKE